MAPYHSIPNFPRKIRSPLPPKFTFKRSPLQYRAPRKGPPPESRVRHPLESISEVTDHDRRRIRFCDPFACVSDEEQDDNEHYEYERPTFTWEDEKTLVSDLLQDSPTHESEDDKLASLADSIQASFSLHSKELLDDIADTLVPAVNRVKRAHQVLKDQVDEAFGLGVLEFDDACKKLEASAIKDHDKMMDAYSASQARIEELFKRLKEAYARRDQLWVDFEKVIDDTINPTIEALKNTPTRMERVIASIEKQSKQIGKADGGNSKYLKGILSKLG